LAKIVQEPGAPSARHGQEPRAPAAKNAGAPAVNNIIVQEPGCTVGTFLWKTEAGKNMSEYVYPLFPFPQGPPGAPAAKNVHDDSAPAPLKCRNQEVQQELFV
jgi:hypothetical protein